MVFQCYQLEVQWWPYIAVQFNRVNAGENLALRRQDIFTRDSVFVHDWNAEMNKNADNKIYRHITVKKAIVFHKSMLTPTYPSPSIQTDKDLPLPPTSAAMHHTHKSCLNVVSPSVLLPSTSCSQFLWVLYKLPATDKANRWVQLADSKWETQNACVIVIKGVTTHKSQL